MIAPIWTRATVRLAPHSGDDPRYLLHQAICTLWDGEVRPVWRMVREAVHRKNRWTSVGRLVRRCGICACWKPLTSYYLINRRDEKRRTRHYYPRPICIPCEIRRKGYRSMAEMRREVRERRRNERVAA